MAHDPTSQGTGEETTIPIDESILTKPSSALITEGEKVAYNGSLHFMMGFKWLACALLCLGVSAALMFGSLFTPPTYGTALQPETIMHALAITIGLVGLGFLMWYLLPFWRSFLVVTNQRALIGVGHFTSVQEQVLPYQLEDWEIRQNFFESLLGYGHVTLRLIEGRQLRIIYIPYTAQPHQFMHHLEELCPPEIRSSAQRAAAAAAAPAAGPETVTTNADPTPPGGGPAA